MKIKKRELKTQLITLSLVLTTFLSSFSYVYASSGTYYLLDIGSYGQLGQYQIDSTGTGRSFAYTVTISLKAKYNGTITITTNNNISNQDRISTYNCEIDNATNTSYTLHIYNSSFCSFIYESDTAKMFTPSSQSLTKVADIDYYPQLGDINTKLTNVYNAIDGVEGYIDNVETYINTLNTTTSTISTNVSDIETTLNDISNTSTSMETTLNDIAVDIGYIDTDVGHIRNLLTTQNIGITSLVSDTHSIKTDLSSVLTTLTSSATDISNGVADLSAINTTLSSMSQNVANLYARVNEINQNVADIEYFLNNSILPAINGITTAVNAITTAINGIDNMVDTITWNEVNFITCQYSTDRGASFNTLDNSINVIDATESGLVIRFSLSGVELKNYINFLRFNIRQAVTTTQNSDCIEYIEDISHNHLKYYVTQSKMVNIYLYNDNIPYQGYGSQNNNFIYIHFDKGRYQLNNTTPKAFVIYEDDIEYWQLLSYFQTVSHYEYEKQHNATIESKLNDILTAINNVHINVSQNDVENVTNNFDNDIDTIHNVENNYKLDFDGWNNQLPSSDISVDLSPYNSTINFIKANITNLWSNPFVNIPIIVSCLCFVFMVILG